MDPFFKRFLRVNDNLYLLLLWNTCGLLRVKSGFFRPCAPVSSALMKHYGNFATSPAPATMTSTPSYIGEKIEFPGRINLNVIRRVHHPYPVQLPIYSDHPCTYALFIIHT